MLEALIVSREDPDDAAAWESWGGPFSSLDDSLARKRLEFLREKVELTHSSAPQPQTRILDYRVLVREVITTPWQVVLPGMRTAAKE